MKDVAISADGAPVQFDVEGDGSPALVFVHGWSCDRTYWRGQVGHFARRHRVVAIDLAGHGESGGDRTAWTMPAFGADVVAVIEQLGLRDPVLVGHSMGGDVIVEAALALSGRVSGLVWVDVYRSLGESRTETEIEESLEPFRDGFVTATREFVGQMFVPGSEPELVEWVTADMSSAPPDTAVDALRHAFSNEGAVLAALSELTTRVVAINTDYWPSDAAALGRYGVELVLMSGVGHFLMLEDPDTFNRLLEDAISSD